MTIAEPPLNRAYSGVQRIGPTRGRKVQINDREAYFSDPDGSDIHPQNAILLFPDPSGVTYKAAMLADQFAAAGYLTVICNTYGKFQEMDENTGQFTTSDGSNEFILSNLTTAQRHRLVDDTIAYLRKNNIAGKIGAVGYGPASTNLVLRLLNSTKPANRITAGFVADPGNISLKIFNERAGPLSVAVADEDRLTSQENLTKLPANLKLVQHPYQVTFYSHVFDGFATRRAVTNQAEVFAKKQAFLQAINWLDEFLLQETQ